MGKGKRPDGGGAPTGNAHGSGGGTKAVPTTSDAQGVRSAEQATTPGSMGAEAKPARSAPAKSAWNGREVTRRLFEKSEERRDNISSYADEEEFAAEYACARAPSNIMLPGFQRNPTLLECRTLWLWRNGTLHLEKPPNFVKAIHTVKQRARHLDIHRKYKFFRLVLTPPPGFRMRATGTKYHFLMIMCGMNDDQEVTDPFTIEFLSTVYSVRCHADSLLVEFLFVRPEDRDRYAGRTIKLPGGEVQLQATDSTVAENPATGYNPASLSTCFQLRIIGGENEDAVVVLAIFEKICEGHVILHFDEEPTTGSKFLDGHAWVATLATHEGPAQLARIRELEVTIDGKKVCKFGLHQPRLATHVPCAYCLDDWHPKQRCPLKENTDETAKKREEKRASRVLAVSIDKPVSLPSDKQPTTESQYFTELENEYARLEPDAVLAKKEEVTAATKACTATLEVLTAEDQLAAAALEKQRLLDARKGDGNATGEKVTEQPRSPTKEKQNSRGAAGAGSVTPQGGRKKPLIRRKSLSNLVEGERTNNLGKASAKAILRSAEVTAAPNKTRAGSKPAAGAGSTDSSTKPTTMDGPGKGTKPEIAHSSAGADSKVTESINSTVGGEEKTDAPCPKGSTSDKVCGGGITASGSTMGAQQGAANATGSLPTRTAQVAGASTSTSLSTTIAAGSMSTEKRRTATPGNARPTTSKPVEAGDAGTRTTAMNGHGSANADSKTTAAAERSNAGTTEATGPISSGTSGGAGTAESAADDDKKSATAAEHGTSGNVPNAAAAADDDQTTALETADEQGTDVSTSPGNVHEGENRGQPDEMDIDGTGSSCENRHEDDTGSAPGRLPGDRRLSELQPSRAGAAQRAKRKARRKAAEARQAAEDVRATAANRCAAATQRDEAAAAQPVGSKRARARTVVTDPNRSAQTEAHPPTRQARLGTVHACVTTNALGGYYAAAKAKRPGKKTTQLSLSRFCRPLAGTEDEGHEVLNEVVGEVAADEEDVVLVQRTEAEITSQDLRASRDSAIPEADRVTNKMRFTTLKTRFGVREIMTPASAPRTSDVIAQHLYKPVEATGERQAIADFFLDDFKQPVDTFIARRFWGSSVHLATLSDYTKEPVFCVDVLHRHKEYRDQEVFVQKYVPSMSAHSVTTELPTLAETIRQWGIYADHKMLPIILVLHHYFDDNGAITGHFAALRPAQHCYKWSGTGVQQRAMLERLQVVNARIAGQQFQGELEHQVPTPGSPEGSPDTSSAYAPSGDMDVDDVDGTSGDNMQHPASSVDAQERPRDQEHQPADQVAKDAATTAGGPQVLGVGAAGQPSTGSTPLGGDRARRAISLTLSLALASTPSEIFTSGELEVEAATDPGSPATPLSPGDQDDLLLAMQHGTAETGPAANLLLQAIRANRLAFAKWRDSQQQDGIAAAAAAATQGCVTLEAACEHLRDSPIYLVRLLRALPHAHVLLAATPDKHVRRLGRALVGVGRMQMLHHLSLSDRLKTQAGVAFCRDWMMAIAGAGVRAATLAESEEQWDRLGTHVKGPIPPLRPLHMQSGDWHRLVAFAMVLPGHLPREFCRAAIPMACDALMVYLTAPQRLDDVSTVARGLREHQWVAIEALFPWEEPSQADLPDVTRASTTESARAPMPERPRSPVAITSPLGERPNRS